MANIIIIMIICSSPDISAVTTGGCGLSELYTIMPSLRAREKKNFTPAISSSWQVMCDPI